MSGMCRTVLRETQPPGGAVLELDPYERQGDLLVPDRERVDRHLPLVGAGIVGYLGQVDGGAPIEDVAELLGELRTLARIGLTAQVQAVGGRGEVASAGGVEEALQRAPGGAAVDRRVALQARGGLRDGVAGRVCTERGRSGQEDQDEDEQRGKPPSDGGGAVRFHWDERGYSESGRAGAH